MRSGIHLGRVFGINIYIDGSWLFIFLLVMWNPAAGVFPELHPQIGGKAKEGVALMNRRSL